MKKELVVYISPKSPVSEIFRTLRTNLQFMSTHKTIKTILITSTMPYEGKTWISSNLAITFAQSGKKVLLIDSDMRKGRIGSVFSISSIPGLSNYLSGIDEKGNIVENDISKYIQISNIENLYIMPSGNIPPNPSELLGQEKTINMINELKEAFDIIIFDGTPSLLVTDALILARIVDTTLIVAKHKATKKDNLIKIKKAIENVGGNIAGVVLNRIPLNAQEYYTSYYYGSTAFLPKKDNKSYMKNIKDLTPSTNETKKIDISVQQKQEILDELNEYLKKKQN